MEIEFDNRSIRWLSNRPRISCSNSQRMALYYRHNSATRWTKNSLLRPLEQPLLWPLNRIIEVTSTREDNCLPRVVMGHYRNAQLLKKPQTCRWCITKMELEASLGCSPWTQVCHHRVLKITPTILCRAIQWGWEVYFRPLKLNSSKFNIVEVTKVQVSR